MASLQINALAETYRQSLLDRTVPFWQTHGVDRELGGYFFYLDRDGSRYGDDKPVWLIGRTIWLYATLYHTVEPRPDWLQLALHGKEFLDRHAFAPDGKMYFLLDREGQPLRMRRYIFSEVFGVLAYAAMARATADSVLLERAQTLFARIEHYMTTPGLLDAKVNTNVRPAKGLAMLMCVLVMAESLIRAGAPSAYYEAILDRTIDEIFTDFVKPERQCVLEAVGPEGEILAGPDGRVMNPGHVIEAAWFILETARRRGDRTLIERTLPLIDWPFERGWDTQYGGLFYFVDVDGKPATQLEHDMKLWWPHCETLYATLLAYHLTGQGRYASIFEAVHEWTFEHFVDAEYGEWFGYLHRDGSLSTPLKGGPWKGPFHVPRAELLCWQLLAEMQAASRTPEDPQPGA